MRNPIATLRSSRPRGTDARAAGPQGPAAAVFARALAPRRLLRVLAVEGGSESGLTLIEVVISAMLVAIIAIGTLTGFDSAGRATADERAHNQATLLAGQDEEKLRGMTAAELGQMGTITRPPITENGTNFTIESSAEYVTASKEAFTCETPEGTADYIQTTSKVTWPTLEERKGKPVEQSSLVAISGSTALLVKVTDQAGEPVEGATVTVTGTNTNASQTTPVAGCVIFGALNDKKVKVSAIKTGWVNANGEEEPAAKEYSLSSTALTSAEFKIARPGGIRAEFTSNGGTVSGVTGDRFYAYQPLAGGFFVGGTPGSFASTAEIGGLYPFPPNNTYAVWAGDCAANSPTAVAGVANPSPAQVLPGGTAVVKVEVPALNITVYKGASAAANEGVLAGSTSAKLTNSKCSLETPLNQKPLVYSRAVSISSAGVLEQKYQPYAKELQLCVVGVIGGKYYENTQTFANNKKAGTTESFFLKKTGFLGPFTTAPTCP